MQRMSISLPPRLKRELEQAARDEEVTATSWIRQAIRERLERAQRAASGKDYQ